MMQGVLRALRRVWVKQDPHSLFVAAVALFFCLTLILDLAFLHQLREDWLHWALLALCMSAFVAALLLGAALPIAVGRLGAGIFIAVSVCFLGPLGNMESAIGSAQQLTILALYLGWFVQRPYGRAIMFVALGIITFSMGANPIFQPGGALGVASAVLIVIINLLAFEVGSALWRRSENRLQVDSLTGALNLRAFYARFDRLVAQSLRRADQLVYVVIDFDDFKSINDSGGHAAGDLALASSVERWRLALRRDDTIGRIGGDEFGILLPKTSLEHAQRVVERLREASLHHWSWGVSQLQAGDTKHTLAARADLALYEMKRSVA